MSPDPIFEIASIAAMAGWLALALSPFAPRLLIALGGVAIPVALSLIYLTTVAIALPSAPGGFGSLTDVMTLFTVPGAALAGWVHFLAFDLAIGGWMVRRARAQAIPHWMILPCLFFTFMLGPIGLLMFLALQTLRTRKAA